MVHSRLSSSASDVNFTGTMWTRVWTHLFKTWKDVGRKERFNRADCGDYVNEGSDLLMLD